MKQSPKLLVVESTTKVIIMTAAADGAPSICGSGYCLQLVGNNVKLSLEVSCQLFNHIVTEVGKGRAGAHHVGSCRFGDGDRARRAT